MICTDILLCQLYDAVTLRTASFFGANMYVKPLVTGEDAIDMHHLIDEQETWMGR